MALGKSVKVENTKMRWNVNRYHCLADKNIAFHIHLHTCFYAIYGACYLKHK